MQKIVLAVILAIFLAAVYLFWSSSPAPVEPTTSAAISSETASAARAHIAELTTHSDEQPIAVEAADHFVTASQLLALPEQLGSETLTATGLGDDDAATSFAVNLPDSGSAASTTVPAASLALNRLRLQELLNDPGNSSRVFYIHGVNNEDRQGLWGIMQHGLTQTFAQGLKLNDQSRTLSVEIPASADERLQDSSSSFLGNLLNRKVSETLVYNYREGLLGDDPNLIKPGQQLIIIGFSEEELIAIYNHFSQP